MTRMIESEISPFASFFFPFPFFSICPRYNTCVFVPFVDYCSTPNPYIKASHWFCFPCIQISLSLSLSFCHCVHGAVHAFILSCLCSSVASPGDRRDGAKGSGSKDMPVSEPSLQGHVHEEERKVSTADIAEAFIADASALNTVSHMN
ncbi:hypothetical protein QQP08_008179 [Theobroma cacao]|nr:hypothetical protein QQP08_008179 [Theobroma cacao]